MRLRVWQDQLEKMKQALAMGLLLVHKKWMSRIASRIRSSTALSGWLTAQSVLSLVTAIRENGQRHVVVDRSSATL